MQIRVINPNTTWSMTRLIGECASAVASTGVTVEAVSPAMGPASIESHYDEALSVPGILAEITRGEADGVDGYVIACFGDPGLEAARELARGPVVGITQACREALALDESDVIVLGCAGMADLCSHISDAIGAPVIDGVAAAVVTVEGLVRLGLRTSGINEYATPPAKTYTGLLSGFQLGEDPAARSPSLGSEIGAAAPHSLPSERSRR